MQDGLLVTHEGKRYFLRPEILTLCRVSDADLAEIKKHGTLPDSPVVPLQARTELSMDDLSHAVGGLATVSGTSGGTTGLRYDTVMCPW
jgi:hypothetical protein